MNPSGQLKISDLLNRKPPEPWSGAEKIPWNEPDFSRRMLESHLAQDHDWASRRCEIIDRHVDLIAKRLPERARILDLGCGPGFYTQRLAELGFDCVGVDFSPASIEYARKRAAETGLTIEYVLEDIRDFTPGVAFDAVLMTFGEFNVFKESDAVAILQKASNCLKNSGFLLLEIQTFDAVESIGLAPTAWQANASGVFSDAPHLCLQETFWDEKSTTAVARHFVIDATTFCVREYGASTKAYREDEIRQMLHDVGFVHSETLAAEDWPTGDDFDGKLQTYICSK